MAQHDLRDVQSEFLAESGRRVVSQLVRVPVRNLGALAPIRDRAEVGIGTERSARPFLRSRLRPVLLRRLYGGLALAPLLRSLLGDRLARLEQIGREIGTEPFPHDGLRLRAEVNPPL